MARRLSIEHLLYALALIIALGLRLINLGESPLSDYEAGWALQGLDIALGKQPTLGAQSLTVLMDSLFFFLFGAGNASARILGALFGSLIVIAVPLIFRRWLGRVPACILAFGLALDPGLVALSRISGSPLLSAGFLLLTLGAWMNRKPVWFGILAGLTLLSGPAVIPGLVGFLVVLGVARLAGVKGIDIEGGLSDETPKMSLRAALWPFVITFLTAGSLFLIIPRGLNAAAAALPAYLAGWVSTPTVSVGQLLVALPIYQPLALIAGIGVAILAWIRRRRMNQFLSIWFLVALLLACLYPGRQVGDLVWALFPLWALAVQAFPAMSSILPEDRNPVLGQALVTFFLVIFVGLTFAGGMIGAPAQDQKLWIILGVSLVLYLLAGGLVYLGWSLRAAWQGSVIGWTVLIALYTLSTAWASAGLRPFLSQELWYPMPQTSQAGLLIETVGDLAEWRTGARSRIDIQVINVAAPSLRWALRDYPQVNFDIQVSPQTSPDIIIMPKGETPSLASPYRGQDFVWQQAPNWEDASLLELIRWWMYRQVPQSQYQITLWARNDLFPNEKPDQEINTGAAPAE